VYNHQIKTELIMQELIYYKYKADSLFSEAILTSGKVYLSTSCDLNDPFECSLQEIGSDWINDKVKKIQEAGVQGFLFAAIQSIENDSNFFGLSKQETIEIVEKMRSFKDIRTASLYGEEVMVKLTGHPPSDSEKMFSQIDAQLQSVGIFSMSAKPDHPLMWAHYAGEHTGICLGFKKTANSRLSSEENFLQVIYSDHLPEMEKEGFNVQMSFSVDDKHRLYASSYKISFSDKTFQKAIVTKPTTWQYEDEWRYIEPYPGLFDWPGQLSDITFGLRCNEERIAHYIRLTEENVPYPVNFYIIQKKPHSNALERVVFQQPVSTPNIISKSKKILDGFRQETTAKDFSANMERLIRQEMYGEVIFQIDENLKNHPTDAMLLNLKGTAHGLAQEPEKALACFIKLTELCPEIARSWYQKSCALIDLKRDEEALEALRIAYQLDSSDSSTTFNLAIQLLKTSDASKEALEYLKRAEKLGHRRAHSLILQLEEILHE
jgi:tetratricopeptide (TPR) repeat protein